MKLCKDCVHHIRNWNSSRIGEYDKCAAILDPVRGVPAEYCDLSRRFGPCGENGHLFKQKDQINTPSAKWWEFWK